jgi:hypothetical protein
VSAGKYTANMTVETGPLAGTLEDRAVLTVE